MPKMAFNIDGPMSDSPQSGASPSVEPTSIVVAADATPDAATLDKREAAAALAVDERTVRRMADDGRLTPVLGADGRRRHYAEQVRQVTTQRRVSETITVEETREGETAAALMSLFDDDVHPVEAIKRLRLPPAVVTKYYREWAELRGGMFVSETQLREICARVQTSFPLRDAAHFRARSHSRSKPRSDARWTSRQSASAARSSETTESWPTVSTPPASGVLPRVARVVRASDSRGSRASNSVAPGASVHEHNR